MTEARRDGASLPAIAQIEHAVDAAIASAERSVARRWGAGALTVLRRALLALGIALLLAWFAAGALFLAARHLWLPTIDERRPQIEALLARQLGAPVRIGRLSASWQGWRPTVKVTDLRVLDADGSERIGFAQVEATLSWLSVPLLAPRFTSIDVLAPTIEVRRAADGQIFIAGFAVPTASAADDGAPNALDWLLEQGRLIVRQAQVHVVDARTGGDHRITDLELDLRRELGGHRLGLQARPPGALAGPLDLRLEFRTPAFERASRVAAWRGRLYAALESPDVAALAVALPVVPPDVALRSAQAAVRLWVDFDALRAERVVADVVLVGVDATLAPGLAPLQLAGASGRVSWRDSGTAARGERELALTETTLQLADGRRLPAIDARLRLVRRAEAAQARGELDVNRVLLHELAPLAAQLPVPEALRAALDRHAPRGELAELRATWEGVWPAPQRYTVRSRFDDLALAAVPADPPVDADGRARVGLPGAARLAGTLELSESGGTVRVAARDATLALPGVFETPELAFARLNAVAHWRGGATPELRLESLNARNDDLDIEASGTWRRAAPGPGEIDFAGRLARLSAPAAHRYVPLAVPANTRLWLQHALLAGEAFDGNFRLRGDLRRFPFARDQQAGEFRVAARLRGAALAPQPAAWRAAAAAAAAPVAAATTRAGAATTTAATVSPGGTAPAAATAGTATAAEWAPLTDLDGALLFERDRMEITARSARIGGVRLTAVGARIGEMGRPESRLRVQGQLQGPLADVLRTLAASPINEPLGGLFTGSRGSGTVRGDLRLDLPLGGTGARAAEVAGNVQFTGNELALGRELPSLARLNGRLDFTERSLRLAGATAEALGGTVRLDATTRTDNVIVIVAAGTATPAGVRRTFAQPALQRLLERAQGSTRYEARVALRAGRPEVRIDADLAGWALDLPPPLRKSAGEPLPLSVQLSQLEGDRDRWRLALGDVLAAQFDRRAAADGEMRIERGGIGVGEPAPLPDSGVLALVTLPRLDIDRWSEVLERIADAGGDPRRRGASAGPSPNAMASLLPTQVAFNVRELIVSGKPLANVVGGATRSADGAWQANVVSTQANGQLTWQPAQAGGPGLVRARLTRLTIPESQSEQLTGLLDAPNTAPSDVPALDVVADEFELGKLRLGRLELQARNVRSGTTTAWQLQKLDIANPDGRMSATGTWQREPGAAAGAPRRMTLALTVEFGNAGRLLGRLGYPDAIRNGSGSLAGEISWRGSPFAIDYPTLGGTLKLATDRGQFLKADAGAGRLLGVMSLQSLPRRISLDFRDVFSEGFAFDSIGSSATIKNGILDTRDFRMRGVNATVLIEGTLDLGRETQNLHVLVLPQIDASSASLVYAALANPAIGLGTFLAQLVLRDPLSKAFANEYDITGSWSDPQVKKRERAGPPSTPENR